VKKALADGAYDSRDNFNTCDDFDVEPGIKVRTLAENGGVVGYVKRQ